MSVNIEAVESKLYAATVADEIKACIDEAIADHGECSIVLSGGRSPSSVYRMLARPPRVQSIDWPNIKLFWGDERWVGRESDQSNYKMVAETLLSHLGEAGPKVFGVDTSLSSPEEGAKAYRTVIEREITRREGKVPKFDIVLLGMGTDGHVASVFPPDHLSERNKKFSESEFCYAVAHENREGERVERVSLSLPILFSADRVIFIVTEGRKADIVERVLGDGNVEGLPVGAYTSASGSVSWFLDSAAASKLKNI